MSRPAVHAIREPLSGAGPPAWAAGALARSDHDAVVLSGRWAGVQAIVAGEPIRVAAPAEDVFAFLDDQPVVERRDPGVAVGGGWFGLLGYGLGARLERVAPAPPPADAGQPLPEAMLAYYDHVVVLDGDGRWWFEALWTAERDRALHARRAELEHRLTEPWEPRAFSTEPFAATPSPAAHAAAVAACVERIAAGDLFQANLSMRLGSQLHGEAGDLHAAGVRALSPDRAAFIRGAWGAVASLSPELFLARSGRRARSAPIKGTRPLGASAELYASAKDRAENVMIVDLVRNDLGRVSIPGSVHVHALAQARAHAGVEHLVSEVHSELRPGVGDGELVGAAFPPGSVTGAPKLAAMDVISELESTAREAYTGAIGFASPVAGLELSVVIRTFEIGARGRLDLQVGGGVVADSDPAAETDECLAKAAPLLAAIGAHHAPVTPDRAITGARAPARHGPRPRRRPDPSRGLLETILVRDGEPLHLGEHLARLETTVLELHGLGLPDDLPELVLAAAGGAGGDARLRLVARADGDGLAVTLELGRLPAPGAVTLHTVVLPGGLGAHKWADRDLLDALSADHAPAIPLLLDGNGRVLEAAFATIVALDSDRLHTPPLDGRILPSITRAHALRAARALGLDIIEVPLTPADLHTAGAVALLSALRGAVAATALDGVPLSRDETLLQPLAAALTSEPART